MQQLHVFTYEKLKQDVSEFKISKETINWLFDSIHTPLININMADIVVNLIGDNKLISESQVDSIQVNAFANQESIRYKIENDETLALNDYIHITPLQSSILMDLIRMSDSQRDMDNTGYHYQMHWTIVKSAFVFIGLDASP